MRIMQLIMALLFTAGLAMATVHTVTTEAEFNALPTLNAGDHVVLQDGNYGALNKTLTSSISDDTTAQTNPVLVYAETPGGAKITAPSEIILAGRGITLAGLDFTSDSGMVDNGSSSTTYLIRMAANSRYMKLSNIRLKDCTSGDDYGSWVLMNGFNNTIEYCTFEGKNEPNANATIAVYRSSSEAGISVPRDHVIRRSYFGPREASTSDNGYESIRIGTSSTQAQSMRVTVEENVFYRAIWRTDGQKGNEPEIISNKTADNIIRNNTFLESQGQITLRHGDRALVEGNFIFGGGRYSGSSIVIAATNQYQGGVRIIGTDHVVRNNYFQNLQGDDGRAALVLVQGVPGFDDGDGTYGDNTYEAAHNARVYNNTFVGCEQMNLGFDASGTSVLPTNAVFYNNAWHGTGSSAAIVRESGFNIGASSDNYIYESNGNFGWTGLVNGIYSDSVSPEVSQMYDNYLIPTSGSPLLDNALAGVVSNDIRGLPRSGSFPDIGCFEREVPGIGNGPLLRNEVGPGFDGGPSGTYPVPMGLDPALPPSGNFDLTQYYLTMPVDATNGFTGEAVNIDTLTLAAGYENRPWFYTGASGEMVFEVPYNGATRGSSSSPRCELRETYPDGNLRNWTPLDDGGIHALSAICKVHSVGDGKVSIGQIHGKVPDTPTVIMRYNNTVDPARIDVSVYDTADGEQGKTWLYFDAPALGEEIDYKMAITGSDTAVEFVCTVNGVTETLPLTTDLEGWKAATFYFKVGAYYTVPDPGETAVVSYSKVELARGDLSISTATLSNGSVDQAYSAALETVGGGVGLTWSVENGTLPPGLALSSAGVISGTPTTNGVFFFAVGVDDGSASDTQSLSLAIDVAGANNDFFSEGFESGQTVGEQPAGASVLRPTSNTTDNYVKIVDSAGNPAGTGNGVGFRDDGSSSTLLSYNFVASADDQVSAVRADFRFAQLTAGGSSSHFVGLGFGEYNTGQSLNSSGRRFTDVRMYADGTIDFRSSGGSQSNGNAIPGGSNLLSIFVSDHDGIAVDYFGPDGNTYSLPANSVAYWLNGVRVMMDDGAGYLAMDVGDSTSKGTVGTTENNLGKFGFYSATGYVDLDFVFDDIRFASLAASTTVELTERFIYVASASADDGNVPENTLDGLPVTRWSAQGDGQWIMYDLGVPQNLREVKLAFYLGDARTSDFEVEVSVDGQNWSTVIPLQSSSGTNSALETFSFSATSGRYLRVVGYGNSENDWNSITEAEIRGVPFDLPGDILESEAAFVVSPDEARLSVESIYGPMYQLQSREALLSGDWVNAATPEVGTGNVLDLMDSGPLTTNRFYRILIQP